MAFLEKAILRSLRGLPCLVLLALPAVLGGCAGPMIRAAAKGETATVARLLEKGASPDESTSWSTCRFPGRFTDGQDYATTPLEAAAAHGRIETVRLLLERGASAKNSRWSGNTPLIAAAAGGHREVMALLLEKGGDIDARNKEGHTPLWYAVFAGDVPAAKFLLDRGADPNGSYTYSRYNAVRGFARGQGTLLDMAGDLRRTAKDEKRIAAVQGELTALLKAAQQAALLRDLGAPAAGGGIPPAAPVPMARIESPDVDQPAYRLAARPDDFAIVIGIEKYSKLPDAAFAGRDADAVKAHLRAMGLPARNIIHLAGSDATRSAVQGYLEEWLPKNVKPESTVFFYYSGHGAPDPATGEAYLVPWDGNPSFLQSSAYPLKQVYRSLGGLKGKGALIALDSCFSGAGGRSVLAQGARPLVMKLDAPSLAAGKLTLLTAAGADEITATLPDQRHGIFTYFLLRGLSGEAKDASGRVTARGLYDYLKPNVQDEAHRQNREQTPSLQGSCLDCELVRF